MSDIKILTFFEKERICEERFRRAGQFWHLYSDGTVMENIFLNDTEMKAGLSILAASVQMVKQDIRLVTFVLMKNHIHLILCGHREKCLQLFDIFKDKMRRIFRKTIRGIDWKRFNAKILSIDSLKALRNEIIYVHRNPFVANPDHTPYGYPWSGGCAYFNPLIYDIGADDIRAFSFDRQRKLTYSRNISPMGGLKFAGDKVFIPSFCDIDLGEGMFTDARSYFLLLTRNAEAYSQIATRLEDKIFLTDDEMFITAVHLAERAYHTSKITTLSPEQKVKLAKDLHFKYKASKQQLRRILRLENTVLDELFPI